MAPMTLSRQAFEQSAKRMTPFQTCLQLRLGSAWQNVVSGLQEALDGETVFLKHFRRCGERRDGNMLQTVCRIFKAGGPCFTNRLCE
jgi:hypothetical protein